MVGGIGSTPQTYLERCGGPAGHTRREQFKVVYNSNGKTHNNQEQGPICLPMSHHFLSTPEVLLWHVLSHLQAFQALPLLLKVPASDDLREAQQNKELTDTRAMGPMESTMV